MAEFFISYSHTDKDFATEFANHLRVTYIEDTIWMDDQLRAGDEFEEKILSRISQCDIFIYLLSNESVNSEWCQKEFNQANSKEKIIIPFQIQKQLKLPSCIKNKYHVDDISSGLSIPKNLLMISRAIDERKTFIPRNPESYGKELLSQDTEKCLGAIRGIANTGQLYMRRWTEEKELPRFVSALIGLMYDAEGAILVEIMHAFSSFGIMLELPWLLSLIANEVVNRPNNKIIVDEFISAIEQSRKEAKHIPVLKELKKTFEAFDLHYAADTLDKIIAYLTSATSTHFFY